jgi:hypothetical protein
MTSTIELELRDLIIRSYLRNRINSLEKLLLRSLKRYNN